MDKIKDYDDEGFELQFEDDTTPEERKYFVQAYTNVNQVAERRIHCTCCDTHIGTAPSAEKMIRMHPVLHVTQCLKCYRFYNSGEFEKGEDGSELYCRWCGQGGDVYCCSDCPYVFCKKCILRNLTKVALHDVTSNEDWKCFSCAPKILYHLRAQHWALVNFIAKQKKKIEEMSSKRDHDDIVDALNNDVSACCQGRRKTNESRKRKTMVDDSDDGSEDVSWTTRNKKKKKRLVSSNTGDSDVENDSTSEQQQKSKKPTPEPEKPEPTTSTSTSKPITYTSKPNPSKSTSPKNNTPKANSTKPAEPTKKVPVFTPTNININPRRTASSANSTVPPLAPLVTNTEPTEIDCTPDLFSYLVDRSLDHSENSVSSSTGASPSPQVPSTSTNDNPQPQSSNDSLSLSIDNVASGRDETTTHSEQIVRRVPRSQGARGESQPVYHNYNGYRIDLNSASQQSTIRLPNGKIIHVKKQTSLNNARSGPTTQFSITTQPSRPTATAVPMATVHPTAANVLPMQQSQQPHPLPHSIQRLPTARVAAVPANPNAMRVPQRFPRARFPVAPTVPPLVINSVSSAVQMPPYAPQSARMRYSAPLRRPVPAQQMSTSHMSLEQAQVQLAQMLNSQPAPPNFVRSSMPPQPLLQQNNLVTPGSNVPSIGQPRIYSNDQLGRARTQLERQIYNAIAICHQIDGKLRTLMNSNAYKDKNVQNLHDIKELYIHLSYLFTYTNGRFQSVHDKCIDDMKRLGFSNDAKSLSSGNVIDKYGSDVDEDDLEIVEPNHQTIDLDSDDERTPEKNKSKSASVIPRRESSTVVTSETVAAEVVVPDIVEPAIAEAEVSQSNHDNSPEDVETGVVLDISSSTENLECDVDIASLLQISMHEEDNGESLLTRMNEDVGIATPPETETETEQVEINIDNDLKLKSIATVSLKPVEKDYPDLMEKAIKKMKESQAAELDEPEEQVEDNDGNESLEEEQQQQEEVQAGESNEEGPQEKEPQVEEPPEKEAKIDSPDQSQSDFEMGNDTGNDNNSEHSNENSNECSNSTNANEVIVSANENQENEPETAKENDNEPSGEQHDELIDCDDDDEVDKRSEEKESDTPEEEHVINEIDTLQAEATTSNQNDEFVENEAMQAKSIETNSEKVESDEKVESLNQECNEITSTSTAIDNDVEMNDAGEGGAQNDSKSNDDADVESAIVEMNEANLADIIDGTAMDTESTQENNETASILSDLVDCNDLVADELSKVISPSNTLDVAALLNSDDFENISSPEAFN